MKIRFKDARILITKDHDFEVVRGTLDVDGKRISKISKEPDGSDKDFDRVIDCKGNLLMPGFKNAHTHTAMVFVRSLADDMPLQEWLFNQIFPREDKLTEEDLYIFDVLGIMEYLTSGITANFDMYYFPIKNARASIDCGFRTVQTSGLNNFGGDKKRLENEFEKLNNMGDLSSYIIGFHGEYTTSMELMQDVADTARKYKSPVYVHNSETRKEVDECIKRWGKTPTQVMDDLGMFEYGGGGYHCVYFDDKDFEIFKNRGLYAVTNPASNAKLASGVCDVKRFLDEGIHLAIGTDGAASNNALDFFREMYLAATLSKIKYDDASVVPANEILYSATYEGAHAMGLFDADSLAEGKLADIVMIDMHTPNMQPENNIVKNLVYSGSKSNVYMTMINGKILYENGKFDIGFDPEEIFKKSNEIVKRIG